MKNFTDVFYKGLIVACFVLYLSCGSDDDPDPGNPNDFCSVELCSSNATLKQVCIDEYNDCVALGNRSNSECAAFAAETCTL